MSSAEQVLKTVQTLLGAVAQLERLYPGRKFSLDGHLVGSVGEVLASELYGLELLSSSTERHDAIDPHGRNVQIKLTQAQRVSMYSEPDCLLVLGLSTSGMIEEIYNGPGGAAWASSGKRQKNGQRSVSVRRLRELSSEVPEVDRLARLVTPDWFSVESS